MKLGMKVGMCLGLGFVWVVLLLVLVIGFGIYNMYQVQGCFIYVVEVKNFESVLVKEMLEMVGECFILLCNFMLFVVFDDVDIEV